MPEMHELCSKSNMCIYLCIHLKRLEGGGEIVYWVKALATKPQDLSWNLWTHRVEEKNQLLQAVL